MTGSYSFFLGILCFWVDFFTSTDMSNWTVLVYLFAVFDSIDYIFVCHAAFTTVSCVSPIVPERSSWISTSGEHLNVSLFRIHHSLANPHLCL
jgi:hypothetical protein